MSATVGSTPVGIRSGMTSPSRLPSANDPSPIAIPIAALVTLFVVDQMSVTRCAAKPLA